jgi:hypothetical protein
MKQFFANKYVKGITQFIPQEHFGVMDFIDYHCQCMGISRDEYMAYYGVQESRVFEEKAKGDRGPIDNPDIETALKSKATETGVPLALLRIIMRRGMDAWNTSHHKGVGQEAWGYARVNAFLEKGKGTWGGADADVAKEVRDGGNNTKLPYKFKD